MYIDKIIFFNVYLFHFFLHHPYPQYYNLVLTWKERARMYRKYPFISS